MLPCWFQWHCGNVSLHFSHWHLYKNFTTQFTWLPMKKQVQSIGIFVLRAVIQPISYEFVYLDYLCVALNPTEYKIKRYIYHLNKLGKRVCVYVNERDIVVKEFFSQLGFCWVLVQVKGQHKLTNCKCSICFCTSCDWVRTAVEMYSRKTTESMAS